MKSAVISALVAALPLIVFAQQQPSVQEEIVVTASALPEKAGDTPASITVVTKQEIDEQAARDVADVLREVPGLTLSRGGSFGKVTSLFTRGAGSAQTLVLWNGIELNNPFFSGFDWGQFSTAGVEQIEVVRGPYSALYGSDAVAGVVNIVTIPRSSGIHGDFEYGGHGLRNAQLGGTHVTSSMQFAVVAEHREDNGFAPNDDYTQNDGSLWWRWTPFGSFSLGAAGRRNAYDVGVPFNNDVTGTHLVPSLQRRGRGHERQLAVPISQEIGRFGYDLTLSENRRTDDFHDPDDPFGLIDASTRSTTRRARFQTHASTFIGTLVAGGEWSRAIVDDANTFGVNLAGARRTDRSYFVEDRYSSDRFQLTAGVRRDDFSTFGAQTSPRLAAAVFLGGTKLRAAWGRGFRAPSIGELYYPFSGNPNLNAEHSNSFEAGVDHGPLSLTLFSSTYRDLIFFDPTTFVFANIGRAKSDGLELGYKQQLTTSLTAAISYTYLHKDNDETTGQRLLRRPKHGGSAFLAYRRGASETNVVVLRTGARPDFLAVAPFSTVTDPSFTTVDVNVLWHAARFTPFVKVENATNRKYQEVNGYPSPTRRTIVGVRF